MLSVSKESSNMQFLLRVASLGYILTAICPKGLHGKCTSPQYGEIGQEGIIKCMLPSSFNGVIWYDSEDITTTSQIVLVERQSDGSFRTSGQGFDSGAYRISSNGSLIIPIVSIHHDRNFTIFSLDNNDEVFQAMVEFITVVRPSMSVPAVNSCEEDILCLINVNMVKADTLTCTLSQARPDVVLSWHHQVEGNMKNMVAQSNVKSDGPYTFTSTSKVNVSELINTSMRVFSCKASGPALSHGKFKTIVVVYNIDIKSINIHQSNILQKIVVINRSLEIPCKNRGTPMAFVWSFKGLSTSRVLAFSAQGEKRLIGNVNRTFDVLQDGTIIFEHVNYQFGGVFICTSIERGESSTFMLRVKVVGYEADERGKGLKIWVGMFVAMLFLAIAGVGFCYVRKRKVYYKKIRYIEECEEVADELLNWPFVFESDARLFSKEAVDLLRSISQEMRESKRSKDQVDAAGASAGIAGGTAALIGAFLLLFTPRGGMAPILGGTAVSVSGAATNASFSNNRSMKDKERLKKATPSFKTYVKVQKSLSTSIAHIVNAYEIIELCANNRYISNVTLDPVVNEVKKMLQPIRALDADRRSSPEENIENVKKYSERLVKTLLRELEKSKDIPLNLFKDREEAFEQAEEGVFDMLPETVLKLLSYRKFSNRVFTFYAFIHKLYAPESQIKSKDRMKLAVNLGSTTQVKGVGTADRVAAQALNATDDVTRIGANVAKFAKGVAVAGLLLKVVEIEVDIKFLGKALLDIENDTKAELPKGLIDTADMMEKMNEIILHGLEPSEPVVEEYA